MRGRWKRIPAGIRNRRPGIAAWGSGGLESLEERKLLSSGLGGFGAPGMRAAEMSSFQVGRHGGFFGGGSLGLGGGMNNPTLLLTAPLLEGGTGQTAPPSPAVFSSSAVQQAFQTLQTDLKTDVPSGAKPTHESVGALQDDLSAIRKGTLSGTAAQTKIQADQAAILSSMGLTQAQITQIQSDQTALQTAITTASTSTTTSTATSSTGTATTTSSSTSAPSSAVQTAFQTLQTELKTDTPSGSTASISHAAIGTVQDDLTAIRNGTLTGTAAATKIQTDTAAVFTSEGLTAAQISQIQSDQQALATAIAADPNQVTTASSSSSTTQTTLQSVAEYLVGVPGVSAFGMRGLSGFGGGMGPGGGFRGGPMMGWR